MSENAIKGLTYLPENQVEHFPSGMTRVQFEPENRLCLVYYGRDAFEYGFYGVHANQDDKLTFLGFPDATLTGKFIDVRIESDKPHEFVELRLQSDLLHALSIPKGVMHNFAMEGMTCIINEYRKYIAEQKRIQGTSKISKPITLYYNDTLLHHAELEDVTAYPLMTTYATDVSKLRLAKFLGAWSTNHCELDKQRTTHTIKSPFFKILRNGTREVFYARLPLDPPQPRKVTHWTDISDVREVPGNVFWHDQPRQICEVHFVNGGQNSISACPPASHADMLDLKNIDLRRRNIAFMTPKPLQLELSFIDHRNGTTPEKVTFQPDPGIAISIPEGVELTWENSTHVILLKQAWD